MTKVAAIKNELGREMTAVALIASCRHVVVTAGALTRLEGRERTRPDLSFTGNARLRVISPFPSSSHLALPSSDRTTAPEAVTKCATGAEIAEVPLPFAASLAVAGNRPILPKELLFLALR